MRVSLLAFFFGASAFAQDVAGQSGSSPIPTPAPKINSEVDGSEGAKDAKAKASESLWRVHWEFQAITLPAKRGRALLPELRDEKKFAEGWDKLQAMIAKDEARVTLDTGARTMKGFDAHFSQGEEILHPLKYEIITGPGKTEKLAASPGAKPNEALSFSFAPTEFKTWKTGISLSIAGAISTDGKRIRLETSVYNAWLMQWGELEVGRSPGNEKITLKLPRFSTVHHEGMSGFFSGERALLGAHPTPKEEGRMELFFLRVWSTPGKEAARK